MNDFDTDVIVVGAGNAAFCAAHAAAQSGARVCLLEKTPIEYLGGNTYFTMGSFRTTYEGLDDLHPLLSNPDDMEDQKLDIPPYTEDDFASDIIRLTHGRTDPTLMNILVQQSRQTVQWLRDVGIEWTLQTDNQSFEVNGKRRFWGGGTIATVGGGKGLIQQHLRAAQQAGVEVKTQHKVVDLIRDNGGAVCGVVCTTPDGQTVMRARAIVLASGGFGADARMRAMYLGKNWDGVKVRGSRYNTGDGLNIAVKHGAMPYGSWSSAHAVAWDANAPAFGDRELTNQLSRHSYPYGIMVNADGKRFVDEGADFRNYTYAKVGAAILNQPGGIAYQLFDQQTAQYLRTDYGHSGASQVTANTLDDLAGSLNINAEQLAKTVAEYNASIQEGTFDPTVRDNVRTVGIDPPKSNWALPFQEPPFIAYPAVCAITFTFGGIAINDKAQVLDQSGEPIAGLYTAGEMVGGLFYENYPGGSGLMAGAVFGRRAGTNAAHHQH